MKLEVLLLRHGQTQGNLEKRYIGKTDEPLSEKGIRFLQEKKKDLLFIIMLIYLQDN
mgnify:CR=1 FL=1